MIYLDHASHTPPQPAVLEAFARTAQAYAGNPLSMHRAGQLAGAEMTRLTQEIADLLHVSPAEIIYTSGATEANNLALKGLAGAYRHQGRHILSTCLEHPSASGTLAALQTQGYEIELLKLLPDGKIDLPHLQAALRPDTLLLCISAVDSELGAVQPIAAIAEILAAQGSCHLHVDAAQAMGKVPVPTSGLATLCFTPHKMGGLCGLGVLVKRADLVLEPQLHGGGNLYRAGTPALALTAACHKALALSLAAQAENYAHVSALRRHALEALSAYPRVRIHSPADGSPYILNLGVTGVRGLAFQTALNRHGVCVSVKSACSTDAAPSRPVMAVTQNRQAALSAWRISFGPETQMPELDAFLAAFDTCYRELTRP